MNNKFLRKSFKFTILTSAFLCLFHSPVLRAETAVSTERKIDAIAFTPTQVWLSYVKTQFQNSKLDLDQQIDNYQFSNPDGSIKFVSERVSFSSHFQSEIVASDTQNALMQLSLNMNAAQVVAHNFNLEAIIQRDLGFGTATVIFDMHCDAIELDLQNTNPVSAEISAKQGQVSVSQLGWDLKNTQVDTKLIGCREVAGFDKILKDQVQQYLQQSLVVGYLQQIVNQKLNPMVQDKIAGTLSGFITKLNLAQTQKYQFDDKNNLWIFSNENMDQTFTSEELQKIGTSTKPAVLIKKKNLEQYAKDYINDILKVNTISSKQVSGMNRLMCSHFLQFFVWPSLRSLSKCFEMRIQNRVQDLKITDLNNLSLSVKVGSWASGEGHQIAYFESGLDAQLFSSSAQLTSFHGQSDPDFVKWSGHSKRISTSVIQPSLDGLLQSTVNQFKNNSVLKLFKDKTKLNLISPETALIEINL
jgi:hypothetical protein